KGEKRLFGTPFSQFIKGEAQLVYNRRLIPGSDQWLVSRVKIGAEHAYGNSKQVPYAEQFYIGGANSIRAFTVRSIGPGSYRAPQSLRDGYFDQTGTFIIELNSEYRFPIYSVLHGAAFVDAGNVWLLKNDPLRPGGTLEAKTFLREIALGTGVGLRVDIGMMVIRGDLGYGLHTPYRNGTPHYFNVKFKDAFAFHLAIGYPF
ncbi:MAG: outer membrane protein assembly factor, partial [Muribaculaceae bacterium]|nr:outer membrane protein assembly factor [Muribaculaceae bacterium]